MNLRLQSTASRLPSAALLGSCSLHGLALLLLASWLATTPPVTLPQLASLPAMTLATPSAPAPSAAAPVTPPKQIKPTPVAKPATPRPVATTATKPTAQPVAHASVTPRPSAAPAETSNHVAAPAAAPAVATPAAPAPQVQEPLYRGGYLNNPKPTYPPLSIEMEETGTVRLRVQVSAQGLPVSVELEHSSGFPRLDRAALNAVRSWKFIPAKRGDEAIPYTFIVPVEFSLKNLRKP